MSNEFEKYFRDLIKQKGFTSISVFLNELCKRKKITRTSFYNILQGKLNPSLERQEQIVETLKLTEEEKIKFFDRLKLTKYSIPADILKYLSNNQKAINKLRGEMKNENARKGN